MFFAYKKMLGRTEMRTRDRMYCQTIRTVRDISRDDRARIATCSLRTPTDRQTDLRRMIAYMQSGSCHYFGHAWLHPPNAATHEVAQTLTENSCPVIKQKIFVNRECYLTNCPGDNYSSVATGIYSIYH